MVHLYNGILLSLNKEENYLFTINLFMAVLSLYGCMWAFSSCGGCISHCGGSFCLGVWTLEPTGSIVVVNQLSCPQHVGSSQSRDQTISPALVGRFWITGPPGKSSNKSNLKTKSKRMQLHDSEGILSIYIRTKINPSIIVH